MCSGKEEQNPGIPVILLIIFLVLESNLDLDQLLHVFAFLEKVYCGLSDYGVISGGLNIRENPKPWLFLIKS